MDRQKWHRYLIKEISKYISTNVEGGIFLESGVKYGTASVLMAKILKRKGVLFDTWSNMPHFNKIDAESKQRKKKLDKRVKGGKDTYQECINNLTREGVFEDCELIRGDICKTLPKYIKSNDISICLLHSDSDLHDPTKVTLECCWSLVKNGGMVLIHDYKAKQWPGIEKCVNTFLLENKDLHYYTFDDEVTFSILLLKDVNGEYKDNFDEFIKTFNRNLKIKKEERLKRKLKKGEENAYYI